MADLVIPDPRQYVKMLNDFSASRVLTTLYQGVRMFNGPDGLQYRWRPNPSSSDILVSLVK